MPRTATLTMVVALSCSIHVASFPKPSGFKTLHRAKELPLVKTSETRGEDPLAALANADLLDLLDVELDEALFPITWRMNTKHENSGLSGGFKQNYYSNKRGLQEHDDISEDDDDKDHQAMTAAPTSAPTSATFSSISRGREAGDDGDGGDDDDQVHHTLTAAPTSAPTSSLFPSISRDRAAEDDDYQSTEYDHDEDHQTSTAAPTSAPTSALFPSITHDRAAGDDDYQIIEYEDDQDHQTPTAAPTSAPTSSRFPSISRDRAAGDDDEEDYQTPTFAPTFVVFPSIDHDIDVGNTDAPTPSPLPALQGDIVEFMTGAPTPAVQRFGSASPTAAPTSSAGNGDGRIAVDSAPRAAVGDVTTAAVALAILIASVIATNGAKSFF